MNDELPALLHSYLARRGHDLSRGEVRIRCVNAEAHANGDQHPSLRITLAKGAWRCDVCGAGGGAIELVAALEGCEGRRAFEILSGTSPAVPRPRQSASPDLPGVLARAREDLDHPDAAADLAWVAEHWRVDRAVLIRYEVGIAPARVRDREGRFVQTFELLAPSYSSGALSGVKRYRPRGRDLGLEKATSVKGSRHALFGGLLLGGAVGKVVLVTGGEKDALIGAAALPELVVVAHAGGEGGWAKNAGPLAAAIVAAKPSRIVVALDANERDRGTRQALDALLAAGAEDVRAVEWPEEFAKTFPKGGLAQALLDERWGAAEVLRLVGAAARERPRAPAIEAADDHLTDLGNARRLVRHHGEDLRFDPAMKKWLAYVGTHWSVDETGESMRRAKTIPDEIDREAAAVLSALPLVTSKDERQIATKRVEELLKHARRSESEPRLKAMIALAQSEPSIPSLPTSRDADPWLLNVLNGTVDLRTGEVRPHDRRDLISKLAPVVYDPKALAPTWDAFLEKIFAGNRELIEFLQRFVGYSLTGLTIEQIFTIFYGSGSNGKSTFLETLAAMLGDYAMTSNSDVFLQKPTDGPRNDVARLAGSRLVAAVEVNSGRYLNEALIKSLTGGDRITARFLYGEFFTFAPQFKTVLSTNFKPIIRGADYAIWRRIRLVPFTVTIKKEEKDPRFVEKLKTELPGVLAWAVKGCLAWQKEGLREPDDVTAATEGYREEMDVLAGFIDECCLVAKNAKANSKLLYLAYAKWSDANGEKTMSHKAFSTRLVEKGFDKRRAGENGSRVWFGLSLTELPGPDGRNGNLPRNASLDTTFPLDPSERVSPSVEREEEQGMFQGEGERDEERELGYDQWEDGRE